MLSMENNIWNVPSVEELLEISIANNYQNIPKSKLLEETIKILNAIPKFYKYLIGKNFDYIELPYILFGEIIHYIKNCLEKKGIDDVREILEFLDKMSYSEDVDIQNLLQVWCLEAFDLHKSILPSIVLLMPENLKKNFIQHYWSYLN